MAGGISKAKHVQNVTLATIAKRNLDPALHHDTEEELRRSLLSLSTVRLDREGITCLGNLECVQEIHSLYLQENLIKKIQNLDVLKNLRFLSLSGNRIEEAANLKSLHNVKFLDLSHNLIQDINTGEFPPGLLILDLTGNTCTQKNGYRQEVLKGLPLLQELDKETVRDRSHLESLMEISNHEIEENNSSDSDDFSPEGLSSVSHELQQRSYLRRERALREHQDRLEELKDTHELLTPLSTERDSYHPLSTETRNPQSVTKTKTPPTTSDPNPTTKNSQPSISSEKTTVRMSQMSANKPSTKPKVTATQASSRISSSSGTRSKLGANLSFSGGLPQKISNTAQNPCKAQGVSASSSVACNGRQAVSAPSNKGKTVNNTVQSQLTEKTRTASHRPRLRK
ncbi:leucine-rich repeat-containing protein 46 [Pelobates fuscus]|uniref:leucine-rich repeat-containing protein 46 n=1 Tax=Pelobates fuscus TaxID=191477 RepID=UPI002FE4F9A8